MVSVRIDETGQFLDLKGERIALNYQVFDIGTMGTVQGTFSPDFNLPDTAYNRAALGNATALNVFESTYRVNQKIPASCFQNNIQISKGFLQITETEEGEIVTCFFGDNVDLFELIRGKKLRDCNLTHLRHAYTAANIVASFNNTSGYIYPVIDYGLFTSRTPIAIASGEIYTAIFASDIMTAIFKDVGFKIEGTMLDRALYKKTIVPFVNNVFGYSKEFVAQKSFRAHYGAKVTIAAGATVKADFTVKAVDSSSSSELFDVVSGRYTADDNYQIYLNFSHNSPQFQRDNGSGTTRPTLYIKINGVVVATSSANTFRSEITTTLIAGDYVEFFVKNNSGSSILFLGTNGSGDVFQDFQTGSIIYPETVLPDMDQVDFLKWVLFRFLAVPTVDLYSKTVYFHQFNDLNNNSIDDWSDKVDISKKINTNFTKVISQYRKKNLALYSIDDKDKLQTLYNADNEIPYGSGQFMIDNDFMGDEATVFETPFSSTLSQNTFGANGLFIPYIPRSLPNETDINVPLPRIITFYGNIELAQISNVTTMTILGTTVTSIPFTYFYKSSLGFGVDDFKESLAFGSPNVFAPNDLAAFDLDYLTLFNIFDNPNTKRAYIKLNQIDIVNLSHFKKKYIERFGGYFYLNIIEEYDASGGSVLCELVKI
jgi:hypothetical protein